MLLPCPGRLADTGRVVVRVIELIAVVLLPTAAVYAFLGSFRLVRWAAERRSLRRPPAVEPIERIGTNLRRLRTELETAETRTDLAVKSVRVRALRGAYLDTLTTACQRLGVSPPPGGDRVPQAEIYRAEAALRQRGLDVRETASP
jgi:hypothetical protein